MIIVLLADRDYTTLNTNERTEKASKKIRTTLTFDTKKMKYQEH